MSGDAKSPKSPAESGGDAKSPESPAESDHIAVGTVLAPWGVTGELKVAPFSHSSELFAPGTRLFAGDAVLVVEHSRPHKGHFLVRFEEVSSREAADEIRRSVLTVPESQLPTPPKDSYYEFQLIGLTVVTSEGESLGTLVKVLRTGANDVYVVERPGGGETLIPAIKDVVKLVDPPSGRMVVDPLPGL